MFDFVCVKTQLCIFLQVDSLIQLNNVTKITVIVCVFIMKFKTPNLEF